LILGHRSAPHHVAVATPNFDETVAQANRGNGVILSGRFGGARVAYLGTDRDLGVIIEIFSGTPDDRPQPDETWP
jgi:methylmalonyl-CoA/ethylmalonyl-CoA epimerase